MLLQTIFLSLLADYKALQQTRCCAPRSSAGVSRLCICYYWSECYLKLTFTLINLVFLPYGTFVLLDVEASLCTGNIWLRSGTERQITPCPDGGNVTGYDKVEQMISYSQDNFSSYTSQKFVVPMKFILFFFVCRGMVDEQGDQFVAYFLPTEETLGKRKRDSELSQDFQEDDEWVFVFQIIFSGVKERRSNNEVIPSAGFSKFSNTQQCMVRTLDFVHT